MLRALSFFACCGSKHLDCSGNTGNEFVALGGVVERDPDWDTLCQPHPVEVGLTLASKVEPLLRSRSSIPAAMLCTLPCNHSR